MVAQVFNGLTVQNLVESRQRFVHRERQILIAHQNRQNARATLVRQIFAYFRECGGPFCL